MANIREAFVSRFGQDGFLVEFDFRQLEICALAEITRDPVLTYELNHGHDIHRANAALWLKKPQDEVTEAQRKYAKIMTFQLQYGASAPKIAETLGISRAEAEEFIKNFYEKYKYVKGFHDTLVAFRNAQHSVLRKEVNPELHYIDLVGYTPTGRSYCIAPKQSDIGDWYYSLTEMKNYAIQGFATADIVPIVLNIIMDKLYYDPRFAVCHKWVYPVGTVHDSFVFDCQAASVYNLFRIVEESFTEFPAKFKELFDYELKLEYHYDVKYGKNWAGKQMDKLSRKEVQSLLRSNDGLG